MHVFFVVIAETDTSILPSVIIVTGWETPSLSSTDLDEWLMVAVQVYFPESESCNVSSVYMHPIWALSSTGLCVNVDWIPWQWRVSPFGSHHHIYVSHDRVGEVLHQGKQLTLTCAIRLVDVTELSCKLKGIWRYFGYLTSCGVLSFLAICVHWNHTFCGLFSTRTPFHVDTDSRVTCGPSRYSNTTCSTILCSFTGSLNQSISSEVRCVIVTLALSSADGTLCCWHGHHHKDLPYKRAFRFFMAELLQRIMQNSTGQSPAL